MLNYFLSNDVNLDFQFFFAAARFCCRRAKETVPCVLRRRTTQSCRSAVLAPFLFNCRVSPRAMFTVLGFVLNYRVEQSAYKMTAF